MAKRFQSTLGPEMEAFLRFKRNLGHPYLTEFWALRTFDRFVAEHQDGHCRPDWPGLISGWLCRTPGRNSRTVSNELTAIRQFCLFRRRYDPASFVPDYGWAPDNHRPKFLPCVLSSTQVVQLVAGTKTLRNFPLRRRGMRLLIYTLYSTGLRLGEAVRLRWADVDRRERRFFIRTSKGRSRWVPFRADLDKEIERYVAERGHHVSQPPGAFLFCRFDGSAYSVRSASRIIRDLMRQAGLKPAWGRSGPRPHDLRHGFARMRLRLWYRSGADLQRRLSDLSFYLGHQNLLGTEIYLKATPDLLVTASRRMAARFRRAEL